MQSPDHCGCRTTVEIRHSRMGFPILPQLSTTAEFFVLDLVAQHNPEPDSKFPGRRDPGLAHSFLDQLATIESFQLRVFSYGMQRRFGPQIAQQRIALLGQGPQPLSLAATVLTRDHPDIVTTISSKSLRKRSLGFAARIMFMSLSNFSAHTRIPFQGQSLPTS